MLNKLGNIDFYMITDSNLTKNGIISDVSKAVDAGCKIIQYREKEKSIKDMIKEANNLKKICNGKAIFLINDRIDVALAVDADGVHIGQDDMDFKNARSVLGDDKIIGITVHNLEEALEAEKQGIDYIGVAPIFQTDTKKDALKPCGIEMIKKIREKVKFPIVAVGGVNKHNLKDVIFAGADSVVSINTVLASNDVYCEIKDFIKIIGECKRV
jgi:thiamine-phosphate pyrophosphorylase